MMSLRKRVKKCIIHHIVLTGWGKKHPRTFWSRHFLKVKEKQTIQASWGLENWQEAKNRNADELTAHGHRGWPAQHSAHAAARHALIVPTHLRAQGHDCQRSGLDFHLSHPAVQRLPIKQPRNVSWGGLGRAAELDGLTRLLDNRRGLRNKTGS